MPNSDPTSVARPPRKTGFPFAQEWPGKEIDGPVHGYLAQIAEVPPLTREDEVRIFRRIEAAEHRAQENLFRGVAIGSYILQLGTKLLDGTERFDRVVSDKYVHKRDAYFHALPQLIEHTLKRMAAATEAWNERAKTRAGPKQKRAQTKLGRTEATLRRNFSKFRFKLRVYEEYLALLRPVLDEIDSLRSAWARGRDLKAKPDEAIDPKVLKTRLRLIETEQRIEPRRLSEIVCRTMVHVRRAHEAKSEIVEANLGLVIQIAKEYIQPDRSFLDLFQEGNMGLMKAVESFKITRGRRFSQHATWWIRQFVTRSIAGRS